MVIHSYKGYEIKKWEKPCTRCIRIEMSGKYRAFIIPRHYPYTIYMGISVSLLSGATFPGVGKVAAEQPERAFNCTRHKWD